MYHRLFVISFRELNHYTRLYFDKILYLSLYEQKVFSDNYSNSFG